MKYELVKAKNENVEYLKKAKLYNIFSYAKELPKEEIEKINKYVDKHIPMQLDDYKMIMVDGVVAGCLYVTNKDDGVLLDEIYIEEDYRNQKIGTNIIKDLLKNNQVIYLWVYKDNKKAIALYERLGFEIKEMTDTRLYMKNVRIQARMVK